MEWIPTRVFASLLSSLFLNLGRINFALSMRGFIEPGRAEDIPGKIRRQSCRTKDIANPEGEPGDHKKHQRDWQFV